MKIAVIGSKGLPPRQGGIEHHCAEIYARIAAAGHQVELFSRSSYNQQTWNSSSIYRGIKSTAIPSLPMRGIDAFSNAGLAALIASLKRFDIIHFHALGPSTFTWIPRLLSPKSKVVVTCHGLDWQRAKWGKFSSSILKLGEKAAVNFSHKLVVVSEDLQPYFSTTYDLKTRYIANAPASYADSDHEFKFGSSLGLTQGKYIAFLARLVPEKRPDLLIKAFRKQVLDGWKLVLVGGGSDADEYKQELQTLAAADPNILLTGELLGGRLSEIIRGAGLFVLPSDLEGQPLALLEAMQEGIPVIASDILIHRKILDNGQGLLFPQGDVNGCAQALQWATQNPDAMAQKAQQAKQYIYQNHNWHDISKDLLSVYEELLNAKAIPTATPVT